MSKIKYGKEIESIELLIERAIVRQKEQADLIVYLNEKIEIIKAYLKRL